jgi:hypothetical protein
VPVDRAGAGTGRRASLSAPLATTGTFRMIIGR